MLNRAPGGHHETTACAAESAAPQCKSQPPCNGAVPDDNYGEPVRETSILGGFFRLAGATAGFLVGGPAGAALGSVVGELAGDIAAERSGMIWPTLGRALFYSRQACEDEDSCGDDTSDDGRHL